MTIALATSEKQLNLSTAHPIVSLPAVACAGCIVANVKRMAHVAVAAERVRSWALVAAPLAVTASWLRHDNRLHTPLRVGGLIPEPPITAPLLPSCRRPAVQRPR